MTTQIQQAQELCINKMMDRIYMSRVKATCIIKTYDEPAKGDMKIDNHWNDNKMVVITIDGGTRTVVAADLIKAIQNCTNV
jgi:hypothetical protein